MITRIFFFLCLSFAFISAYAISPVGYWQTMDEVTGKPQSILHIYESGNYLYGQVTKVFSGYDINEVCTACKGTKHNHPVVGTIVMEGLMKNSEWSGGRILDTQNGKTYRCMLTVMDQGQRLNVRAYMGFSLFGRTQKWMRVG